jgi:hypothetical protein
LLSGSECKMFQPLKTRKHTKKNRRGKTFSLRTGATVIKSAKSIKYDRVPGTRGGVPGSNAKTSIYIPSFAAGGLFHAFRVFAAGFALHFGIPLVAVSATLRHVVTSLIFRRRRLPRFFAISAVKSLLPYYPAVPVPGAHSSSFWYSWSEMTDSSPPR